MNTRGITVQVNAVEQCIHVSCCIQCFNLNFESVNEILRWGIVNESYRVVLSHGGGVLNDCSLISHQLIPIRDCNTLCTDQFESSTPPPPPATPQAFELLKNGLFKFPPLRAKKPFKNRKISQAYYVITR